MQRYADEDGGLLEKALHHFRELGYATKWTELNAEDYGVPRIRRRLFIVGNRISENITWPEKKCNESVNVWNAISDLPIVPHGHREDKMLYESRGSPSDYQQLLREGAEDVLYNHQTRWHRSTHSCHSTTQY